MPQAESEMGHVTVYKQAILICINNANYLLSCTYLLLCAYLSNMEDLETALISSLPQAGFYISDFITEEEEEYLLHKVPPSSLPNQMILYSVLYTLY